MTDANRTRRRTWWRRPTVAAGDPQRTLAALLLGVGLVPLTIAFIVLAVRRGAIAWGAAVVLYGVLAAGVVALAVGVSRRLARPVEALRGGLRRIGEGDLDHRLDIPPEEDVAQLAAAFNAMSGRLAEAYRTLEQSVADRTLALTAVHTIAVTANRSLDPDEILGSVLDRLPVVLNLEAAFIRLRDEQGLRLRAQRGVPAGVLEAAAVCPVGEGLSGRVAAHGTPLVADAQFAGITGSGEAALFREGFRVAACVPITAKGHVLGTLAVASRYPRPFTPQDVQLLTSIGSQVGTALENAGLYERACEMVKDLEELNRLKTEFLSNVGHELRIPLTAIIGFAELLLERIPGALNADQERYVRTMLESGRDLLGMINNLLDLSKLKAGKVRWRAVAFDVRPLVDTVAETVRPLIVKQHLHLAVEVDDGPVVAFADEGLVKQVLLNLLSNAVKFTPAGGTVSVQVRALNSEPEGGVVELRVEDTGIGIPQEDLERIFQEFHQVDGGPTREYPGTGLGLAIAKRLVELQGGRIWAESRVGEGSRFTVHLPRGHLPEAPALPIRQPSIMQSVMESLVARAVRPPDMHQMPKLAVVASPAVAEQVRTTLEPEGYEVRAVTADDLATVRPRPARPFAVMVDAGDEAALRGALAARPASADAPVIAFSASRDGIRACAVAAVGVVATPIVPEALRAALRGCGVLRAVKRRPTTVLAVAEAGVAAALQEALRPEGVGVHRAEPEQATAVAGELCPDVVLVDVRCADPFALAQRLVQHAAARAIPLMLAVPNQAGAEGWARLAEQARQASTGGELIRDELVGACYRLERALPDRAGLVDPATRVYTARYLRHCVVEEVDRAWRLHRPFSIILLEADPAAHAAVGGSHGADRLLRELADVLRRHTRAANPICRYSPETFAVLLTETSKESARFVAEKLRRLIADAPFPVRAMEPPEGAAAGFRVTVSGGVATFFTDGETADDVLTAASRALKRAKQGGGNRIEAAERTDREQKQAPVTDQ